MLRAFLRVLSCCVLAILASQAPLAAQSTTGTIQGTVKDNQDAVVPGATVTIRNVATNATRSVVTEGSGNYRFLNVPIGSYEVTVELAGFSKLVRSGITRLAQPGRRHRRADCARVGERIDRGERRRAAAQYHHRRSGRAVRHHARLRAAGAEQPRHLRARALGAGRVAARQRPVRVRERHNFSSNGMRVRSNNFMIDGQDSNDPSVTGRQQPINNTDIVQEIRLITNQFAAETGAPRDRSSTW